jgi:thiol:disulfide interchange protein
MLVFALNMSGVFEFGLGATGVGSNLQMKGGYAGSFFTGVLATVVATPCSAPFLAPRSAPRSRCPSRSRS